MSLTLRQCLHRYKKLEFLNGNKSNSAFVLASLHQGRSKLLDKPVHVITGDDKITRIHDADNGDLLYTVVR